MEKYNRYQLEFVAWMRIVAMNIYALLAVV